MRHLFLESRPVRLLPWLVLGLVAAALSAASSQAAGRDPDRDGMPNRWEVSHGLNPSRADARANPDHDGLSNLSEYRHHTHPKREDSDLDGLDDGDEVGPFDTNPVDSNSDDDALLDGDEDADHDGLANEDEDDALETCVADDDDSDRDGIANEDENDFGTKVGDGDSDDDGIKDGNEDADEDGLDDEDEDDSAKDECDGDHNQDGVDEEDENDVFGTIVSYDAGSGLLTISSTAGHELSGTVIASTELEWDDDCPGGEEASASGLTPGTGVGDLELDDESGAFEELELICPLASDEK